LHFGLKLVKLSSSGTNNKNHKQKEQMKKQAEVTKTSFEVIRLERRDNT
jgi:hypothetical protein